MRDEPEQSLDQELGFDPELLLVLAKAGDGGAGTAAGTIPQLRRFARPAPGRSPVAHEG